MIYVNNAQSTKKKRDIQKSINSLFDRYPVLPIITEQIKKHNGTCYLVGGAVRDIFLGIFLKDIDIEIHGIPFELLAKIIDPILPVFEAGKSFGILKAIDYPFDFSVPRTDSSGRHPSVDINPDMGIEMALKRRDLTFNAMAINIETFELVDPYNGLADLTAGIIRATDTTLFAEDPLRFFRIMKFVSRFGMTVEPATEKICSRIDISLVSQERIESEFDGLLLQSQRPSLGIRWLHRMGRLSDVLPELAATFMIDQEKDWHPEGSVFEHLMQTLDAAADLMHNSKDFTTQEVLINILDNNRTHKLIFLYSALCHDLGKVATTRCIDGRLRSWGHDEAGVAPTKSMLQRITGRKKIIDAVLSLVKYHMRPGQLVSQKSSASAYKRLADQLHEPLSLGFLALLFQADRLGRNGVSSMPLKIQEIEIEQFIAGAEKAGVLYAKEEPLLTGKDFLDRVTAGPELGRLVKKAYEIQLLSAGITKEALKEKVVGSKLKK